MIPAIHYRVRPPAPVVELGLVHLIHEDNQIHFPWGCCLVDLSLPEASITDLYVTHFSLEFCDFADALEVHSYEVI